MFVKEIVPSFKLFFYQITVHPGNWPFSVMEILKLNERLSRFVVQPTPHPPKKKSKAHTHKANGRVNYKK